MLTLLFVLILTASISAQPSRSADPYQDSLSRYIQKKYGLDQELYNGYQFYERYIQYKGIPYYPDDSFYPGEVTIKGVHFENLQLKYDAFSQFLTLEYTDFNNRYNQLLIDKVHIDSFRLGTYCFEKMTIGGEKPLFYQVLKSKSVIFFIHWKKNIVNPNSNNYRYLYEFTKPIGVYYIRYNGQTEQIRNRKSFVRIFPEASQPEIKKYFRQRSLSFRKASSKDIQNLLDFIDSHLIIDFGK